jgi:hypothetical protein
MDRGRRFENIIAGRKGHATFVENLKDTAEMRHVKIDACCLVLNHMLFQTPQTNIASAMRHIHFTNLIARLSFRVTKSQGQTPFHLISFFSKKFPIMVRKKPNYDVPSIFPDVNFSQNSLLCSFQSGPHFLSKWEAVTCRCQDSHGDSPSS